MASHSNNHESQALRMKKLSAKEGKNIILKSARHNLREIQAEQGADSHIDQNKTPSNKTLEGASDAAGVAACAIKLMHGADIGSLRKDAVLGIEIILSLPSFNRDDVDLFFNDVLAWAKSYFELPVLSAVVHMDESCPHCHIILLPLRLGKMCGSKVMGYKACQKAIKANFHEMVGQRYGLTLPTARRAYSRTTKERMAAITIQTIRNHPQHLDNAAIVRALEQSVSETMPLELFYELGLDVPVAKKQVGHSFVEIMTKPCKFDGSGRGRK